MSQSRTVLSKLAEASFAVRCEGDAGDHVEVAAERGEELPVAASKRRRSPRADGWPPATASTLPSGENFRSLTAPRTLVSTFAGFAAARSQTVTRP